MNLEEEIKMVPVIGSIKIKEIAKKKGFDEPEFEKLVRKLMQEGDYCWNFQEKILNEKKISKNTYLNKNGKRIMKVAVFSVVIMVMIEITANIFNRIILI